MSLGACTELSHFHALASVKPNSRNCKCTAGISYGLRNAIGGYNGLLSLPRPKRNKNRVVTVRAEDEDEGLTYKGAGVDIDAGSELVRRIAKMAPGIGGFGGLFPWGKRFFLFTCLDLILGEMKLILPLKLILTLLGLNSVIGIK
ncbi:phosphoribosylformylglycinamidine cyclo-ligase, chloroplastic/mitochondrial [Trifolium repens]|nr:phosphoribosylformylglycinamidine cyclo-ligase, chloroplastic/mitochondrial [Trifolium repens]